MRHNIPNYRNLFICSLILLTSCGCETAENMAAPANGTAAQAAASTVISADIDEMRKAFVSTQLAESDISSIVPAKTTAMTLSDEPPESYFIENVPLIHQLPDFPTGCESVSACMLLQYNGYDISPEAFINDYLRTDDDFYHKRGVCWGPDPYQVFVGDPKDDDSYGCMSPVIADAFDRIFGNSDWGCITDCTTLSELCDEYICNDIPVMVWVSMDMDPPRPGNIWTLPDGFEYQWLRNEHCMVLVGYDERYLYFNDPYTGRVKKHTRKISEKRYEAFEMQSIVIFPD